MYRYQPGFDCDANIDISGKDYFYGCEWFDNFMFRNPESLPRFGHLARKVLMHYAGEHYNPHKTSITDEVQLRYDISDFIAYKIEQKTPDYDRDWLDHYFRFKIGNMFNLDLEHDMERLKQGLQPPFKGKLHDIVGLPV